MCSTDGAIFKRLKKIDCKSIPIVGSVSSNLPCTTRVTLSDYGECSSEVEHLVCNQGGIGATPIIPLCFRSSVVEHRTFNPRVDGSNPSVGTMIHKKRSVMFVLLESRTSVNGQTYEADGANKVANKPMD